MNKVENIHSEIAKSHANKSPKLDVAVLKTPVPDPIILPQNESLLASWPLLDYDSFTGILNKLKSGSPKDPLPISVLKQIDPSHLSIILNKLNFSLLESTVPLIWKHAVVTPLLKKPTADPGVLSNY